ncbi:ribonuclease domain-containing protein [Micromonospora taraxaci]
MGLRQRVGRTAGVPRRERVRLGQRRDARAASGRTCRRAKGFPTSRGWYSWSGGKSNFAGGQFYNYEGQLPTNATYNEYDVYPRTQGAARDAYRIVVNRSTGVTWFSPNHYTDFYRL